MSGTRTTLRVCSENDVDFGSAIRVEVDDLILAVFNLEGIYYVTDDTCTHGPGSLSEGYIDGHSVECDFHNGVFDICTGEVLAPPCMIPVKTYKTFVEHGDVVIEV